ncbi:MAG: amino acid permease C-terminal domain-containing protein, partial [Steroidobacteraceae bacterium]
PMGVIFCAGMAASLPTATWWRLVLWSAVGIAVYLLYGYRNSRLRTPEIPGGAASAAPAAD